VPLSGVLFRPTRPLHSCQRITDCGASRRGRAATKLFNTGRIDAHNANLAPFLTLIRHELTLLTISRERPARLANIWTDKKTRERVHQRTTDGFSLSLFLTVSLSFSLSLTLFHYFSRSLQTTDWSCRPQTTDDGFSLFFALSHFLSPTRSRSLSHSLAVSLFRSLALSCRAHIRPTMDSLSLSLARSLATQTQTWIRFTFEQENHTNPKTYRKNIRNNTMY